MADKIYLDEEGVKRLKKYIDDNCESLKKAVDLLKDTYETPETIQQMIDAAINDATRNELYIIYGGAAPKEGE